MSYAVTAWNRMLEAKERMKISDVKVGLGGPIWKSECLPAHPYLRV